MAICENRGEKNSFYFLTLSGPDSNPASFWLTKEDLTPERDNRANRAVDLHIDRALAAKADVHTVTVTTSTGATEAAARTHCKTRMQIRELQGLSRS